MRIYCLYLYKLYARNKDLGWTFINLTIHAYMILIFGSRLLSLIPLALKNKIKVII